MMFDYVQAWNDLAAPAFRRIMQDNPELVDAMLAVKEYPLAFKHGPDKDIEPVGVLDEAFNRIHTETLSLAAFVVRRYGEWFHADSEDPQGWLDGTTERFAAYADMQLRRRLGVSVAPANKGAPGQWWIEIISGTVLLGSNVHRLTPVAFAASPHIITIVRQHASTATLMLQQPKPDSVERTCMQEAGPTDGLAFDCFQLSRFVVSSELFEYREACRKVRRTGGTEADLPVYEPKGNDAVAEYLQSIVAQLNLPVEIVNVMHVNHRLKPNTITNGQMPDQHPFVVGPKHIAHASDKHGGTLSEATLRVIPCAGCGAPYESHIADKVAVLALRGNVKQSDMKAAMEILNQHAEPFKIDGYLFRETPEKYRVTDDEGNPLPAKTANA